MPTSCRRGTDVIRQALADIVSAIGLLSRLPAPGRRFHDVRTGPESAWAYPVAGAIIGAVAAVTGALAGGLPTTVQAALILATLVILTGAIHEDGLADSADGLWGGWEPERRLEIMKDSRIGAFGVLALILSLLIRWAALVAVLEAGFGLWAVVGVAAMSRIPMVALMAWLPPARAGGLAAGVGAPPAHTVWKAVAAGLVPGLATLGFSAFWLIPWIGIVTVVFARIARRRIGGQTGDILGATQQLAEMAALTGLCAIAP